MSLFRPTVNKAKQHRQQSWLDLATLGRCWRRYVLSVEEMRTVISFIALLSLSCVSHASSGLEGSWEWEGNSDRYVFGIKIAKSGDHFTGTYCAVAHGGLKIDCGLDDEKEFLIKEVSHSKYELEFETHFSESRGRASLSLQEGILTWSLLSPPAGEHYLPKDARLHASSDT